MQTHPSSHHRRSKVERVPLPGASTFKNNPVEKVYDAYKKFAELRLNPSFVMELEDNGNDYMDNYDSAWNAYFDWRVDDEE